MGNVAGQPAAYVALLSAFDYFQGPSIDITLVLGQDQQKTSVLLNAIGRHFLPGLVLRRAHDSEEFSAVAGQTTVYVCAAGACRPPIVELAVLNTLLDEIAETGVRQS